MYFTNAYCGTKRIETGALGFEPAEETSFVYFERSRADLTDSNRRLNIFVIGWISDIDP
jgi:hypothetical protein